MTCPATRWPSSPDTTPGPSKWEDSRMEGSPPDKVAQGREALRVGDAVGARSAFGEALAAGVSGTALEGMSAASYVLLEFPRSIDEMERAHAAFRSEKDGPGAVRTART